jgi:hypothetical protein
MVETAAACGADQLTDELLNAEPVFSTCSKACGEETETVPEISPDTA